MTIRNPFGGALVRLAASAFLVATTSMAAQAQQPVEVTSRDVAASNAKLESAYNHLVKTWTAGFSRVGERFETPGIARYRSTIATECGVMRPSNAFYCPLTNTIYFDDVFVAGLAKRASNELGTDGDMAGIGVIAHEMGHAVAIQLGYESRAAYQNESVADCLAGAFAREARRDGMLESGDIEEAFFGMSLGGDPEPQLTGNQRVDRRILMRRSLMGHGTREQRMDNFQSGLDRGAGACLPVLNRAG
jgi:uncharacterized protein